MSIQEYLVIENNVVTNSVMWDGNPETWAPPEGMTAVPQATTPSIIWTIDRSVEPPDYALTEQIGQGTIGFTWDGTVLTTNETKPTDPIPPFTPTT